MYVFIKPAVKVWAIKNQHNN